VLEDKKQNLKLYLLLNFIFLWTKYINSRTFGQNILIVIVKII